MPDRCIFFDEVLRHPRARSRSYAVIEPPNAGLACVDVSFREGADWLFARRWIPTKGGVRELYRTLDRLEAAGFGFRVGAGRARRRSDEHWSDRSLRASELERGLSEAERRIHAELFPEETRLLSGGYDWDFDRVYKDGSPLPPDPYGRLLDRDGDVLYEWVRVADEFSWRRYPLGRLRVTLPTSTGT